MPLPTNTPGPIDPRQGRSLGDEEEQATRPAPRQEELSGGLPAPPLPPVSRPRPPLPVPTPPQEEDIFEQIPVQEVDDEDFSSYLEPEYEPEPEPAPRPAPRRPTRTQEELRPATPQRYDEYEVSHDPTPPEGSDDEPTDFVDPKKKKLKPFGGSKSKKKSVGNDSAAGKYDSREDRRTKARIVQVGAIVALIGMVGVGGYNALNPPVGVSPEEVNAAIAASRAADSFPEERGASFAEDFLGTYLSNDAQNATSQELLSYYYTGTLDGSGAESTAVYSNVSQSLAAAPKTFKYTPLTNSTAAYELGALVQTYSPDLPPDPNNPTTADQRYKWVYYNVNVYYDETTDTMAVTRDSPSLIPGANFGPSTDVPEEKKLGTGEASPELQDAVRDSLYGYLEAFAVSTPTNHDLLNQYLIDGGDSGPELVKGLGGRFELSGGADTAVQYEAFLTEDPNVTKLDVNVAWRDLSVPADAGTLVYTSRYYIEMAKQANGQWLVTAFAPKYFVVDPGE